MEPVTFSTSSAVNAAMKTKRDKPICTHYGILGHTIDKCYKLHGYQPDYKFRPKSQPTKPYANQANFVPPASSSPHGAVDTSSMTSLSPMQCQQLITLFNSQLAHGSASLGETQPPEPSISNFTGIPSFPLSSSHYIPPFSYVIDTDVVSTPSTSPTSPSPRPHRVTKPPTYLQDYHVYLAHNHDATVVPLATNSCFYPLSQVLTYDRISSSHQALTLAISSHFEPQHYSQAAVIPEWQEAMNAELRALKDNSTWSLTVLPQGKHPVGSFLIVFKYCRRKPAMSTSPEVGYPPATVASDDGGHCHRQQWWQ
ncbi:hypothetical protein EZV62_024937 [Acer yangbiense]|uniref:Reverse transcriptase Ty1/copia-type domain-containing protein n=1 Tax=Acer yangbiense TaxID=1000413 RepID=A0A5C7GXM3_9ROSI|nr:hypothetical protein EZV62_024937 [Acer yangbiense]